MQRVLWELYRFFLQYPTKILLAETLFFIFMPKREKFWLRFIPGLLALLVLPYFVGYYDSWLVIGEWFTFSFLIQFILSIGLVLLSFKVTWQQAVFYCSSAYAIEHCIDCARRVCFNVFFQVGIKMGMEMQLLLYLTVMAIGLAAFYFIFVRNLQKLESPIVNNLFVIVISAVTILVTNVMSLWITYVGYDIYHKLYDALACVLLLVIQYMLFYMFELVKKNEVMKCVLSMNEEQHRLAKENIEIINLKCHDIRHQLKDIRHLANNENIEQSLKDLEKSIVIYDSILKTGNPTLDTILTEKKLYCDRYHIRFSCIMDGSRLDFMEDEDLYALFGNALDNAIDSVMNLEKEESRIISIKLSNVGKMLSLHFDNYCAEELVFRNGLPQTTKKDKNLHGYGMRSIHYVVEKYGGKMSVFQKDNTFNLNILFPIAAETTPAEEEK